jgi:hypothetical protein
VRVTDSFRVKFRFGVRARVRVSISIIDNLELEL